MPELPEVETTRAGIAPYVVEQSVQDLVVRNRNLRWPVPANLKNLIINQTIRTLSRRGKYLIASFDHGHLLIHLGMSGSLRLVSDPADKPRKHDHIEMTLSNRHRLRYHDPRRFGCWLWWEEDIALHPLIAHLGPEPLSRTFSSTYLFRQCQRSRTAIKTLLMDSQMVVGVGNIYANEALFISSIHPLRPANSLTEQECLRLHQAVKDILRQAIRQGGTTLRDFVNSKGQPGYFAQQLKVYGKGASPCPICQHPLDEVRLSQRSTVFCPQCQS